jgi:tRNA threonylcarbamoyladenosine biosynthesis protein TsaB
MNILTFDTATEACTVALQCGDAVFYRHQIAPQQHAKLLLPLIQSLIDEANIKLSDLNAIGFGCGPGSFMGVRLATGMAQGLGFGLNIPLIPISTLQTIAQTTYQTTTSDNILAGWDARMNEIYWGFYQLDENNLMQPTINDQLSAPEAVDTAFVHTIGSLAGNAWKAYRDRLPSAFSSIQSFTDLYPEAKAMLPIAISKYVSGEAVAAVNAHPHYVRHHVVHNHK